MREDFSKVLCERPRIMHSAKNDWLRSERKKFKGSDPEEWATKEPMCRYTSGAEKELSENFEPLLRFLRSRTGKPWDKVYREIRAQMDTRSAVQAHIFQHLWHFVERNPVMVGREAYRPTGWYETRRRVSDFYVDPHGILRFQGRVARAKLSAKQKRDYLIPLPGGKFLEKIGEQWFEITVGKIPVPLSTYAGSREGTSVHDIVVGEVFCWIRSDQTLTYSRVSPYGKGLYAATKKAADKKTIKRALEAQARKKR